MPAPTVDDITEYLGEDSWTPEQVDSAFLAEKAAQAKRCRVPADDADWDEDLVEALCRRVAVLLAKRNLPLGVSASIDTATGFGQRFTSQDPDVARLEAPYRKVVVG